MAETYTQLTQEQRYQIEACQKAVGHGPVATSSAPRMPLAHQRLPRHEESSLGSLPSSSTTRT